MKVAQFVLILALSIESSPYSSAVKLLNASISVVFLNSSSVQVLFLKESLPLVIYWKMLNAVISFTIGYYFYSFVAICIISIIIICWFLCFTAIYIKVFVQGYFWYCCYFFSVIYIFFMIFNSFFNFSFC